MKNHNLHADTRAAIITLVALFTPNVSTHCARILVDSMLKVSMNMIDEVTYFSHGNLKMSTKTHEIWT